MLRSKLPHVGTTIFTVMTNRARELNAINLAQGFPDYDAPAKLKDLVAYHVAAGHNQYAPMIGVPALREQIALKLGASYGRLLDSETEITITLGATEGIFSAVQALVHPLDHRRSRTNIAATTRGHQRPRLCPSGLLARVDGKTPGLDSS